MREVHKLLHSLSYRWWNEQYHGTRCRADVTPPPSRSFAAWHQHSAQSLFLSFDTWLAAFDNALSQREKKKTTEGWRQCRFSKDDSCWCDSLMDFPRLKWQVEHWAKTTNGSVRRAVVVVCRLRGSRVGATRKKFNEMDGTFHTQERKKSNFLIFSKWFWVRTSHRYVADMKDLIWYYIEICHGYPFLYHSLPYGSIMLQMN